MAFMTKVIRTFTTKDIVKFKTINEVEYTIDRNLPVLILESGYGIVFPGVEMFGCFLTINSIFSNGYVNEDTIDSHVTNYEDVDPNMYSLENNPISSIGLIKFTSTELAILCGQDLGIPEYVYLYKLKLESN
jgi:hypothetical protein